MRYMMLLSVILIFGLLIYFFTTSKFSILSPSNPASNIDGINKSIDDMGSKVNRYNSSVENIQLQTDEVLK